ncbi:MAG: PPC domain-containing protein [Chloroflexota bacterium]|nr:PPC domain-containing protein [Chloroflexota bacterium]
MINKRVLWLTGMAGLVLLLANLGCSVCPLVPQPPTVTPSPPPPPTDPPTPEATPTPEPTPTSETSVEMVLYTNPAAGFNILYPEDWTYQAEAEGVFFSESNEALEAGDPGKVPFFVVFAGLPEDIEDEFGTTTTAQNLLDSMLESLCEEECETGESESLMFGETPGVGMEVSWLDSWTETRVYGYMIAAMSDEVAGIGLGLSPEADWTSHEPIFRDMFASLEFFPPEVPKPVERGLIQPGETVQGALPLGGTDVWHFDAQAGQYVTVQLDAVDPSALDTFLELYDDSGILIADDDDGGQDTNALIVDFYIDTTGTYDVLASTYSGEGGYRLGLEVTDKPSGGGEIAYGDTVEAMLRGGSEQEWVFHGEEGDEISIAMRSATIDAELDCYLELYSPDDELLIYDDDSGEHFDAWIEYYVLPADGLYRIVTSDISGEPGEYELALEKASLKIEGNLTYDQVASAMLKPGARHHWLFEGGQGDVVTISMIAIDEDMDTFLELFAPNGEQVVTDDDSGGNSDAAILEFALPHSGTYRVVARGYTNEDTGAYELTLKSVQLEIEGTLTYDQVASATLKPGARHHWLFEGERGDIVTISMIAVDEDMDTFLELFAPNSEQVVTDDDSGGNSDAAILEFELLLTGTYRVVARGFSDYDEGKYELTLTGP